MARGDNERLIEELKTFFDSGKHPLHIVPLVADAWEIHLSDRQARGNIELEALLQTRRSNP